MSLSRRAMILGMVGSGLAPALAAAPDLQVEGGIAFGSSWRAVTDNAVDLKPIRPALEAILAEIDTRMSPYRAASSISAFNNAQTTSWQRMPPALCQVAAEALRIARLTGGAFDPTVGPVVSRFGFGPIRGRSGPYTGIAVDGTALRKSAPRLTLDFCGIAKGYALDQVADMLSRAGVDNALVEIGGEARALGRHPDGRPWYVAIADPDAVEYRTYRIVAPGRYALATSGHTVNGIRGPLATSHIIDPHRARPASTALSSVSVLAATGMVADALATALCAAGPEAGVALARRLDIAALFVMGGTQGPSDIMTGRFKQHVLI